MLPMQRLAPGRTGDRPPVDSVVGDTDDTEFSSGAAALVPHPHFHPHPHSRSGPHSDLSPFPDRGTDAATVIVAAMRRDAGDDGCATIEMLSGCPRGFAGSARRSSGQEDPHAVLDC